MIEREETIESILFRTVFAIATRLKNQAFEFYRFLSLLST